MTRATFIRILLLVLLAFIICLPEFFSLYKVLKVKFTCWPCQLRGGANQTAGARKNVCNSSQSPGRKKWEEVCPVRKDGGARRDGDQEQSWFRCEADRELTDLYTNNSHLALYVQVSLELRLRDAEALNVTLWGLSNHSSLHLHPPEGAEEQRWEVKEAGGETGAFYCCYPGATSKGLCLLRLFNQTALRGTENNQPLLAEEDEWSSGVRVVWLLLLCLMLLIVFTVLFGHVCSCKKPKNNPGGQNFTGQHLNGTPRPIGKTPFWTELSPIHEAASQDETETMLDGNNEQSFTANLHHRCHHTFPPADGP